MPFARAQAVTKRVGKLIGVTRVAMITGLSPIKVPNAQAFRPDGVWSTTVGGGKSESPAGARIGAVMEEIEKWCQERFQPEPEVVGSFARLARRGAVDPSLLALPHDTCYAEGLEIGWIRVPDLLGGRPRLVPLAALVRARLPNDLLYSPRVGGKLFHSSGLASALTFEEAVLHGVCEVVERHANILAEIVWQNPGDGRPPPFRFVDPRTVPASTRALAGRIARGGYRLELLDITSEIRVPTFLAAILEERAPSSPYFDSVLREARGTACHPDPEVAINMAVLEACQTVVGNIAGAREDLAIKVRSLGRHERTRAETREAAAYLRTLEGPVKRFDEIRGLVSRDVLAEIRWTLDRIAEAGLDQVLVADLSRPEVAPARVVRALIPGVETITAVHTGARARVSLIRDLLPMRPVEAVRKRAGRTSA